MKRLYLITFLLFTTFTFGQVTSSPEMPGEFVQLKAKDFVYDGKSGFVFFEKMIYEDKYGGTEWWTSMKPIWKGAYIRADKASKKYNIQLKEILKENFKYKYQILEKYKLSNNAPVMIEGVLNQERYVVDFVIETTTEGNIYTRYYIYDMQNNKQYFIKATNSLTKLLEKLIKTIES